MKLYEIEGNKLTQEIERYLAMMRVDFEFEDLTRNLSLKEELAERSGGDLRLVWIEISGQKQLISSLAEMCQFLNHLSTEINTEHSENRS